MITIHDGLDDKTRQKITGILKVLFPNAKIYLFGSRAKGAFQKYSDIDLALDENQEIEYSRIGEAKSMLMESNIPYTIDIVDLNENERLKNIILKEGALWKM